MWIVFRRLTFSFYNLMTAHTIIHCGVSEQAMIRETMGIFWIIKDNGRTRNINKHVKCILRKTFSFFQPNILKHELLVVLLVNLLLLLYLNMYSTSSLPCKSTFSTLLKHALIYFSSFWTYSPYYSSWTCASLVFFFVNVLLLLYFYKYSL